MKVACWEHRVWRKRNTTTGPKTKSCKQDASSLLGKVSSTWTRSRYNSWVWTEEAEIQVYQEELEQTKQAAIFSHESSRGFLSFLKPEDVSYKVRVQWDLEDRMMRMMSARRTTFSGNKMPAGLDENLNLNLRRRLRFQANIVRWNRCCRREEKLSSWWVEHSR